MILIHTANEAYRFVTKQIISIEAEGNYSNVRLSDGYEYLVSFQLGQIESIIREQLNGTDYTFVRVGKSLIVNMDELRHINISRQTLEMNSIQGEKVIFTASREALKKLMHLLVEHRKKNTVRTISSFNAPHVPHANTGVLHGYKSHPISDNEARIIG